MSEETRRRYIDARQEGTLSQELDAITDHVLDVIDIAKWRQIQVLRDGEHVFVIQPPDPNVGSVKPAPAKCGECGGTKDHMLVRYEHPVTQEYLYRPCSRATPPSAKGATKWGVWIVDAGRWTRSQPGDDYTFDTEAEAEANLRMHGPDAHRMVVKPYSAKGAAETSAPERLWAVDGLCDGKWTWGRWDQKSASGIEYIRADEVERRVAEAEGTGDILGVARILDRKPGETCAAAARRVVAALNASVASEAALLEGVRKAEASEQAAQAKVRELEALCADRDARLTTYEANPKHQMADARAETAERELSISKDDYRKACDELRTAQNNRADTERELGEARAELLRWQEWLLSRGPINVTG